MKIKDGFMLRQIVGTWLVVPVGERVVDFNGMITLSDTGAFLWKQLQEEKTAGELIDLLMGEYEVERETAKADIEEFLDELKNRGLIEQQA